MLDFGFSEILLTSAIALVVLGPERLPKVARQVGNWMGRARAMARQLSEQLEREVSAEELMKAQSRPRAPAEQRLPAPYVAASHAPPATPYIPPAVLESAPNSTSANSTAGDPEPAARAVGDIAAGTNVPKATPADDPPAANAHRNE